MTIKKRQPKGIPVGGQFATSERGATSLRLCASRADLDEIAERIADGEDADDIRADLGDFDLEAITDRVEAILDQRAADAVDQAWDPGAYAARQEEEALRRVVTEAYASARRLNGRRGATDRSNGVIDVDDLAQEGPEAVIRAQSNGQTIVDPVRYAHKAIWAAAGRAGGELRSEDRRALKMLAERESEMVAVLGRPLNQREREAIAQDIYDNWHDPRHLPSRDFATNANARQASLDEMLVGGLDVTGSHGVGSMEDDQMYVAPGSYMDKALDAVEGIEGDTRDARRMMWNALAEISGGPLVEAGSLSQRKITEARALMKNAPGGVHGALDKWEQGHSDAQTEAFFAPWGTQDPDVRDAVVAQMRRFNDRAEDMWVSALRFANTRNA